MESTYDKPIHLVALDIDGTLLNSALALSERNERALNAAQAEGVQIVLATGKTRGAGRKLIERLGITAPGIYLQGCLIYDPNGTIRHQQTLDPDTARYALTYGEDRGFQFIAYSGGRILVRRADKTVLDGITRYHEPYPEIVGPLQNLVGEIPINKLMALGEPRAIKALRWQLQAQLSGAARLMQAGIATMLEILPPGASKGSALKILLKQLKLNPENAMAMGDAENDMETLEAVGLGVAVGNAEGSLKAVAKFVVGTNDEDGVAEAIERFVLRREIEPQASGGAEKMIDTPPKVETAEAVTPEKAASSKANP